MIKKPTGENSMKKTLIAATVATAVISLYGAQAYAAKPDGAGMAKGKAKEKAGRYIEEETIKRGGDRPERMERERKHKEDRDGRSDDGSDGKSDDRSDDRSDNRSDDRSDDYSDDKSDDGRSDDKSYGKMKRVNDDDGRGLEKQREMKMDQEQKELGKGSEKGQEMREEHSRKWWKFWGA